MKVKGVMCVMINMEKKYKKGISGVVATVMLIALVLVMVSIVWFMVNGIIEGRTEQASSCFKVVAGNNVFINREYTCIQGDELRISVGIGDLEVDGILVSISDESNTKSFKLEDGSSFNYVKYLSGDNYGESVDVPGLNSGKTYSVDLSILGIENPDIIRISPEIEENQCEVSDSVYEIPLCSILLN